MRYGLEIAAAGECGDPRSLADLARAAEDAGFDGVFLEDYVVHWQPGAPTFDPWLGLAAMALATTRIRLGTSVTPLPRRRPWQVARQAATLDHLSGGRFTLGVGAGGTDPANFDALGEAVDPKVRAAMLDEGLDVLDGLWGGRPFAYRGEHYRVDETTFRPSPVQRPRIPLWVGGDARRAGPVRRAARCDGMVPVPVERPGAEPRHLDPDEVRALLARVHEHRGGERRPFDLAIGGLERGPDTDRRRAELAALERAGATWYLQWVPAADAATMRRAVERGPLRVD